MKIAGSNADKSDTGFSGEFWQTIAKSINHQPTLFVVGCFSILVVLKSPIGWITFNSKDIIGFVFPVAGTIVALALPAAQLSGEYARRAEETAIKILKVTGVSEEAKNEFVCAHSENLRNYLEPARRAIVFALLSFLLSAAGVLCLFTGVLADLVASSSLAFLVASTLWFYPTAVFAFGFDILKDVAASARVPPANGNPAKPAEPLPSLLESESPKPPEPS